jgi:nucleoside-diphosphate-sugar epimerase
MRVLVTGHNGYIGSLLMPLLVQEGHEAVGLDTFFFEECVLGDAGEEYASLRRDIRDISASDLEGFDAIAHLAALSNDPLGDLRSDWTYDINHRATVRLAEAAKKAGVRRFLYSSSCSMYGASGDRLITEDAPLQPLTPYADSKVRSESDLSRLAGPDFCPVFLRNATAYGVSPRLRADIVLNNLVAWACTTGKIRIMSDGTPWRPIVHAEDIARAFVALLAAPAAAVCNQAFNVGVQGENYQVRDLAQIVRETVPGCDVEFGSKAQPDPRNYRVDFSKLARVVPELRMRWNARSGAAQLYEGYRAAGLTLEEFQGRKYTRLQQMKHLLSLRLLDDTLRWANSSASGVESAAS